MTIGTQPKVLYKIKILYKVQNIIFNRINLNTIFLSNHKNNAIY